MMRRSSIEYVIIGFCFGALMMSVGFVLFGPDLIAAFIVNNQIIGVGSITVLLIVALMRIVKKDMFDND